MSRKRFCFVEVEVDVEKSNRSGKRLYGGRSKSWESKIVVLDE